MALQNETWSPGLRLSWTASQQSNTQTPVQGGPSTGRGRIEHAQLLFPNSPIRQALRLPREGPAARATSVRLMNVPACGIVGRGE